MALRAFAGLTRLILEYLETTFGIICICISSFEALLSILFLLFEGTQPSIFYISCAAEPRLQITYDVLKLGAL